MRGIIARSAAAPHPDVFNHAKYISESQNGDGMSTEAQAVHAYNTVLANLPADIMITKGEQGRCSLLRSNSTQKTGWFGISNAFQNNELLWIPIDPHPMMELLFGISTSRDLLNASGVATSGDYAWILEAIHRDLE